MRNRPWRCASLAAAVVGSWALTAAGEALEYRTPGGVTFRVTADGLSSIRLGDRELAGGSWSVFNAEGWFKDGGSGAVSTKGQAERSIAVLGPARARVQHAAGDVVCLTEYTFDGEDVLISARVENHHAAEPMNIVGFAGLTFHFDRPPAGLMYVQHVSYFQAHGVGLCHPGHWAKIGGSHAADSAIGVGTSPWSTGLTRTLTLWDYASWAQDKREKLPDRKLLYFVVSPVPARGANTYDFRLRVSHNRDWRHLLGPYREHFQRTFGPVQYTSDYRWIASDYLNRDQKSITPANPYGFHGGFRRVDTAEGAAAFCKQVIGPLKDANGQGVIVWGQGGDDPRGGMYRPDFDVLPPEVEANWPAIAKAFAQAGLKLGVCTRPRHLAVRRDWRRDEILDINPRDAGHVEMLWRRFKNMIDKGCSLFYLDSFGSSFEDVLLMRQLRQRMGGGVLTFAEHQCDAVMPFSGGYSETSFHTEGQGSEAHYRLWSGVDNWRVFEFLAPGSQIISRLYQGGEKLPQGFQPAEEFFYRNRITPLLPVSGFKGVPLLRAIQPRFVTGDGQWRPADGTAPRP